MSRHKLIKTLNLDDELDDYDGALEDELDEELSPEDRGITIRLQDNSTS